MTQLKRETVHRFLKGKTELRVSDMAASFLAAELEEIGTEISDLAVKNAKHAGRMTVKAKDIELAVGQYDRMDNS